MSKPPDSRADSNPKNPTQATPSGETGPPKLHPAVPGVVSLALPGLGLLLLKTRDRAKDALTIFGVYFAYCAVAAILTPLLVGLCCWLPLPLLHLAAGIHSFDEATLQEGGKPLLFQNGFRLFKDGDLA